jgi:hypothetical protein
MKKIMVTLLLVVMGFSLHAQIPTVDISSLSQLVQQYQTMVDQYKKATEIADKADAIWKQDIAIQNMSLGTITDVGKRISGWMKSLGDVFKGQVDYFASASAPITSFDNSINYWARQVGADERTSMADQWNLALSHVNSGSATETEKNLALAGYNARIIDNARSSRAFGGEILNASAEVVSSATNGTLIEQAGAQNALLYQQTALLDKMKNDVNDATVAEAAQREHERQKKDAEARALDALNNIPRF